MIESLLHKEETDRQYFRGKVDLVRSLFDKQRDLNGTLLEVNNIQLIITIYQQSSHLGGHATLCRDGFIGFIHEHKSIRVLNSIRNFKTKSKNLGVSLATRSEKLVASE